MEALLAVVEVGALQHSVISHTLRTSLRTQHRPGEARSRSDGQKASSCEQPVGVARAGDSAPLAARSRWNATLSSDHHAQESVFDPLRTFLSGSQNSTRAGLVKYDIKSKLLTRQFLLLGVLTRYPFCQGLALFPQRCAPWQRVPKGSG